MNKRQILERIYDKLYERAAAVLDEFKPCEHKVENRTHSCIGQQAKHNSEPQCCCSGCKFFENGCKAEKPLTCKTWLCFVATEKYPEVAAKLNKIKQKALHFNFYVHRGDKTASINKSLSNHFCWVDGRGLVKWTNKSLLNELKNI